MPLAIQAILPLVVVLVAAVVVQLRRRNRQNGWIAAGATLGAAIIALVELLRLAPGEHVDVPYLTTFPYADLMIRLDGLSLGFVTVTLMTAAFLMLVRQWDAGDRRSVDQLALERGRDLRPDARRKFVAALYPAAGPDADLEWSAG
jgi:formate hydrogenlyase subunit 3/multisubunit Na+/H+ antiporter MnhD subunit